MGRNVVVWSGGADSTALLDYYAGVSSEDYPTVAICIDEHPQLAAGMLENQRRARNNYLQYAKKKGYHIDVQNIKMNGNFNMIPSIKAPAQMILWLSLVVPCLSDGDTVLFGYIRGDAMWHFKREFVDCFNAMCAVSGISVNLEFPYEFRKKYQIIEMLKKAKIPQKAWWTCDEVKKGSNKPCGACSKCRELLLADFERELNEISEEKK